jgi:hypothetical protein
MSVPNSIFACTSPNINWSTFLWYSSTYLWHSDTHIDINVCKYSLRVWAWQPFCCLASFVSTVNFYHVSSWLLARFMLAKSIVTWRPYRIRFSMAYSIDTSCFYNSWIPLALTRTVLSTKAGIRIQDRVASHIWNSQTAILQLKLSHLNATGPTHEEV